MRFERRHTKNGQGPFDSIGFRKATSEIKNPDGTIVFRAKTSKSQNNFHKLRQIFWRKNILEKQACRQSLLE